MQEDKNIISLINVFSENFEKNIISKFIISNINKKSSERSEFKAIHFKPFLSKSERKISAVYKYANKDITKNYNLEEVKGLISRCLENQFLQADLFTTEYSHHFLINRLGRSSLTLKKLTTERIVNEQHNRAKVHIIKEGESDFLKLLGVYSPDGFLRKDKSDKFKQINNYLEFFAQAIKDSTLETDFSVADMGSGKGYLTFAMYDYLVNKLAKNATVTGLEYRSDMVNLCNDLAQKAGFENLKFVQGTIETSEIKDFNILIALHACDTATDEAIFKGIKNEAQIIMVSPCCHKQIRKQMKPAGNIKALAKFGIIEERTAEIITDTIRALILDAYGYTTSVFEFIASNHTPKNLMIRAVKTKKVDFKKLSEVKNLKQEFGIEFHYLEKLLEIA